MNYLFLITVPILLLYGAYILKLHWVYGRYRNTFGPAKANEAVSIIIPFRNEAESISKVLNSIQQLHYPKNLLELILVDDHSEDNGSELVQNWAVSHPNINLKLLRLKNEEGKKAAIKLALENSSHQFILQTDADCEVEENWVEAMVTPLLQDPVQVVIGTVQMLPKSSISSKMMALEFASLQASGMAMAMNNLPIMSNAANLAYRKQVWTEDFVKSEKWVSGDDVFLVQAVSKKNKKSVVANKHSIVRTKTPEGVKHFLEQRIRWGSKTGDYPLKQGKWVAALVFVINLLILLMLFAGIFKPSVWEALPIIIVAKAYVDFLLLFRFLKDQRNLSLMGVFPLVVIVYPFYICYTVFAILLFSSKIQWKDRAIKK